MDGRQPDPDDPLNDSGSPPNDGRPPICPACGVTMVPAELSAWGAHDRDWVCLECEEIAEPDEVRETVDDPSSRAGRELGSRAFFS
jgi:hypothetical protein